MEVNGLAADAALLRDAGGAWSVGEPSPGYPNTEEGIRAHAQRVDTIRQSAVRVSEVMSRNTTVGAIDRSDWVELQNISDAPVSLAGLFLSDDPELPGLFPLPDVTLQPGGRVVFYCNEANLPDARNRQTNFRLNGDGAVYLYDADGRLLDGISYTGLPMNVSRGRMDTEPGLFYFSSPTPGGANTGGLRRLSSAPEGRDPAGCTRRARWRFLFSASICIIRWTARCPRRRALPIPAPSPWINPHPCGRFRSSQARCRVPAPLFPIL